LLSRAPALKKCPIFLFPKLKNFCDLAERLIPYGFNKKMQFN